MMVKKTYHEELKAKLNAASGEDIEKKRLMLYLPPDLHARLKGFCEDRTLSMNKAVTICIETMLDHIE